MYLSFLALIHWLRCYYLLLLIENYKKFVFKKSIAAQILLLMFFENLLTHFILLNESCNHKQSSVIYIISKRSSLKFKASKPSIYKINNKGSEWNCSWNLFTNFTNDSGEIPLISSWMASLISPRNTNNVLKPPYKKITGI